MNVPLKKDKPQLLLLTHRFPFDKGEEFLETEILYLAKQFEVTIIPIRLEENCLLLCRNIPENVYVHDIIAKQILTMQIAWKYWFLQTPKDIIPFIRLISQELFRLPHTWKGIKEFIKLPIHTLIIKHILENHNISCQFDVFYSYWLKHGALVLTLWKEKGNIIKAISRTHRFDLYTERGYQFYQKRMMQKLDRIVCISRHGHDYLSQRYANQKEKIHLSYLGVLPASQLTVSSNERLLHVVTCSYLVHVKRVHIIIQALEKCAFPIKWTHLGGGALQKNLEKEAYKLPSNISWHFTGIVPNKVVLAFYKNEPVDVFINVSSSEGLPVSIMEAMSYGIPVIATDVGGSSELVNNKNGFLLPSDVTSKQLVDVLHQFYDTSFEVKKSMRQSAWQTWSEKVNAEKQYTNFTNWLISLISN